jgi:hypothetical protein
VYFENAKYSLYLSRRPHDYNAARRHLHLIYICIGASAVLSLIEPSMAAWEPTKAGVKTPRLRPTCHVPFTLLCVLRYLSRVPALIPRPDLLIPEWDVHYQCPIVE